MTRPALRSLLCLSLALALTTACKDDPEPDGTPDAGPAADAADADASDVFVPPEPDVGDRCPVQSKPECQPNAVPPIVPYRTGDGCRNDEQCPGGYTCERTSRRCRNAEGCLPAYECHECPRDPDIRCPSPLTPLKDRYGCISAESECGCTFSEPPDNCGDQVPDVNCAEDGRWCYTGGCVDFRCECVATPDCPFGMVEDRDGNGCRTGRCVPPQCPPVEVPDCGCGQRAAIDGEGCPTGVCRQEPAACAPMPIPECPAQSIPDVNPDTKCMTGGCAAGSPQLCTPGCETERDCATSDECVPYVGDCKTCQPRACEDDLDCPRRTDCVAGRCRTREQHTCDACADLGLECDDAGCGKCAAACDCRAHDECPLGTRCLDCACVPGCRTNAECAEGTGCDPESGECLECQCQADEGCAAGRFCNGCFCEVGCRNDGECPPWESCPLDVHQCLPIVECGPGRPCADPSHLCVDQRCTPNPGVCAEDGTVCVPKWRERVGWLCLKEAQEVPGCPIEGCEPDEGVAPPVCTCDIDECRAAGCDGPSRERCPAGPFNCAKDADDYSNPSVVGICREGRPIDPRRLCRDEGDCVPEECEAATYCVNNADASCRSIIPDGSEAGRPTITGCSCVRGVCVTDYVFEQ